MLLKPTWICVVSGVLPPFLSSDLSGQLLPFSLKLKYDLLQAALRSTVYYIKFQYSEYFDNFKEAFRKKLSEL